MLLAEFNVGDVVELVRIVTEKPEQSQESLLRMYDVYIGIHGIVVGFDGIWVHVLWLGSQLEMPVKAHEIVKIA